MEVRMSECRETNYTKGKVRQLQRKLYQSASISNTRRFHALFDKIYRIDILKCAWEKVKSNKGAAGIDGETIEDIKAYGIQKLLLEIQEVLKLGGYNPPPVKRVYIPKENGKERPLGIPTVKDRIVQAATKIVIEPIFEADFKDNSYGFRPQKNQHQALEVIKKACNNKGNYVLDADIKGYFNNINHEKLILLIERRISDKRVVKLIRKWLKVGTIEAGQLEHSDKGSPQGSVISPLLSNIYLDYLDTKWKRHYSHLGKLVRFADDFVVISKSKKAIKESANIILGIMKRLDLELNMDKTKIVNLWNGKEGFDFLGFHNRKVEKKTRTGRKYYTIEQWIRKKAIKRIKLDIKDVTSHGKSNFSMNQIIKVLNRKIVGWRNYYGISIPRVLLKLDSYIQMRIIYWYNKKHQRFKRQNYHRLRELLYASGLKRVTVF